MPRWEVPPGTRHPTCVGVQLVTHTCESRAPRGVGAHLEQGCHLQGP